MPEEAELSFEIPENASPAEPTVELAPEETLGNQFLHGIPDQDRGIVAKYITDWDGKVTKRFQSIHDQYKPYKELGELEQLQAALNFQNNFRSNGNEVFKNMIQHWMQYHGDNALPEMLKLLGAQNAEGPPQMTYTDDNGFDPGEPPDPRDIQLQNMQEKLDQFEQWQTAQEESRQLEEANKQLDSIVQNLHNQHGDFDDTYVITQIAAGATPEKAIEAYQNLVKGISSQTPSRTPFKTMGGQGGVPSGQVDVTKLDKVGRKAAVAQMLANLEQ